MPAAGRGWLLAELPRVSECPGALLGAAIRTIDKDNCIRELWGLCLRQQHPGRMPEAIQTAMQIAHDQMDVQEKARERAAR